MSQTEQFRVHLFKRQKIQPASYISISEGHTVFLNDVCGASFVSNEKKKDNLFIAEMAANLVMSMTVILCHSSNIEEKMGNSQLKALCDNSYTFWSADHIERTNTRTDIMQKNFNCIVLAFNTLYTVFSPIHTAKSKVQNMETDLIVNVKKLYFVFLHTIDMAKTNTTFCYTQK